jgi:oxaloacetate decarboxylase (Na+ extruding) subunit alpha
MSEKKVAFGDVTLRDGAQSLWAMSMNYGCYDAVADQLDQAGYNFIELPAHAVYMKMAVRYMKENPWDTMRIFKQKITKTKKSHVILDCLDVLGESEPRAVVRFFYELMAHTVGGHRFFTLANTRDEIDRYFPWLVPIARDIGLQLMLGICYYPNPRTTDEYYANVTKRVVEWKPDMIQLKDAGGLLSLDRIKTLLPAIQKEAKGIPIELHTHGMSTHQGLVVVEAMKMGVDCVHTCVPPLANGSSHISIYNAMHNAHVLGVKHNITNVEALEEATRRLRKIGKIEGFAEGVPLEYDEGVYKHQVPGGVISNLRNQLGQLHIADKIDEVLDEVIRIVHDLGDPIMITPASQFIVSQAAVNVATGERYKEILDCMIETAVGVWGWEDAAVPYMDPNIRDKFMSHPNAKTISERWEKKQAIQSEEGDINKLRATYGMTTASDEDFMLYHIMKGDREIKQISKPYKSYYTGREPLVVLLEQLSKDHDVSRLTMHKGDTFFDFSQK